MSCGHDRVKVREEINLTSSLPVTPSHYGTVVDHYGDIHDFDAFHVEVKLDTPCGCGQVWTFAPEDLNLVPIERKGPILVI